MIKFLRYLRRHYDTIKILNRPYNEVSCIDIMSVLLQSKVAIIPKQKFDRKNHLEDFSKVLIPDNVIDMNDACCNIIIRYMYIV